MEERSSGFVFWLFSRVVVARFLGSVLGLSAKLDVAKCWVLSGFFVSVCSRVGAVANRFWDLNQLEHVHSVSMVIVSLGTWDLGHYNTFRYLIHLSYTWIVLHDYVLVFQCYSVVQCVRCVSSSPPCHCHWAHEYCLNTIMYYFTIWPL